ncbi:MAG: hypothetical protein K2N43_00595 [Lachnospiraceae bacterium]|nr:hypothetical protein [Lachnospiraceae bacterium]
MTVVSGVAFWLRAARVIAPVLGESRVVSYLGKNTYAVMMHHIMAFMLIKMILAGIAAHTGYLADFDFAAFYGNIDYYYMVKGSEAFQMVYLAAGVALPLLLQRGIDWFRRCAGLNCNR